MANERSGERKRWGAEQRLEFIEFRAFWEGGINRSEIMDRFGISMPQASNDLTQYREIAPGNLDYDASVKRYVACPDFKPRIVKPSGDRYLAQLRALAEGVIDLDDTWLGRPPTAAAMPIPSRLVEPNLFRTLLAVIRDGASIEALYQSMNPSRPDALWRRFTPHALGSDGLRWHVRAYCHLDRNYKDFVLSRVRGLRERGGPGEGGSEDRDWNAVFEVILEPNPALSEGQRAAVAWEYAMPKGRITLPVRYALLYYLRKRLRLDVADDLPSETPVVVANRADFNAALASARGVVVDPDKA